MAKNAELKSEVFAFSIQNILLHLNKQVRSYVFLHDWFYASVLTTVKITVPVLEIIRKGEDNKTESIITPPYKSEIH